MLAYLSYDAYETKKIDFFKNGNNNMNVTMYICMIIYTTKVDFYFAVINYDE